MLIPRAMAQRWRGTSDPATGASCDFDADSPKTDYDRACVASMRGHALVDLDGVPVLVLYTELDRHAWDADRRHVYNGGWRPDDDDLDLVNWSEPLTWTVDDGDLLLMNSAVDGAQGLEEGDAVPVRLVPGSYVVEFGDVSGELVGYAYRFTPAP